MDDERRKVGKLEGWYLDNKAKIINMAFFVCIESAILFMGSVIYYEKHLKGESNEAIAYGIGTAALMGYTGWLGIKSYRNTK